MSWNGGNGAVESPVVKRGMSPTLRRVMVAALVAVVAVVLMMVTGNSKNEKTESGAKEVVRAEKKGAKGRLQRQQGKKVRQSAKEAVRSALPKNLPKKKRTGLRPKRDVDLFSNLTGEDRRMAEAVQNALDEDDLTNTVKAATASLMSTNAEVRLNAVDALGWFGVEALPEITGAMSDPDDDVRQAAANHFELAVQNLEKPEDQFNTAMAAFGTLTDEDELASLAGILNGAATELIDNEEDEKKAAENRLSVVQNLVDIIEGGGNKKNIAAAKELFNDITGNEWRGIDEAERYLNDPENYEPPDDPT